jgi:integrase
VPPRPKLIGDKDRLISGALRAKVLAHLAKDKAQPARLAILLADQAGLRCSEIVHLKVSDCDLEAPPYRLMIRGAKHRAKDHVDEQPIPDDLRDDLLVWIDGRAMGPDSYLVSDTAQPWSRQNVYRLVKAVHRACDVPSIYNVHSWRHGYGTRVYKATHDLVLTQRMLRHRSTQPTERYVHMVEGDERVAGLMGVLANASAPAAPVAKTSAKTKTKARAR